MKRQVFFFLVAMMLTFGSAMAQNPRMHLIEDGTFTSCGHCPCNDSVIRHNVIPRVPNTSFVRYHWVWSGLYSVGCDSVLKNLAIVHSAFNINRSGQIFVEPQWVSGYDQLCDQIVATMKQEPDAPVKMLLKQKAFNEQTRELTFSMDFTPYASDMNGNYMVNAVVTENKILFRQSFHDSCGKSTSGDHVVEHSDVARKMAYTPFAEVLKTGFWSQTETISRNFSIILEENWIPQNCAFTVYIYQKEDSLYRSKIQQALREWVSSPLGTDFISRAGMELKMYPVPALDIVNAHFFFTESGMATLTLADHQGRPLKTFEPFRVGQGPYNYEFNISDFQAGLYFLKLSLNNKTVTGKFVVSR